MEFDEPEEPIVLQVSKAAKLTADNLRAHSAKGSRPASKASSKKSKKSKPAWATTEKQQNDAKEDEIDNLIDFAYDLDYEKYMEDYEVRQALAIIKDRVKEIKQDDDWKQNIADEWNQAAEEEPKVQAPKSVYSYSKYFKS